MVCFGVSGAVADDFASVNPICPDASFVPKSTRVFVPLFVSHPLWFAKLGVERCTARETAAMRVLFIGGIVGVSIPKITSANRSAPAHSELR